MGGRSKGEIYSGATSSVMSNNFSKHPLSTNDEECVTPWGVNAGRRCTWLSFECLPAAPSSFPLFFSSFPTIPHQGLMRVSVLEHLCLPTELWFVNDILEDSIEKANDIKTVVPERNSISVVQGWIQMTVLISLRCRQSLGRECQNCPL